jgi:hypothetical protein
VDRLLLFAAAATYNSRPPHPTADREWGLNTYQSQHLPETAGNVRLFRFAGRMYTSHCTNPTEIQKEVRMSLESAPGDSLRASPRLKVIGIKEWVQSLDVSERTVRA